MPASLAFVQSLSLRLFSHVGQRIEWFFADAKAIASDDSFDANVQRRPVAVGHSRQQPMGRISFLWAMRSHLQKNNIHIGSICSLAAVIVLRFPTSLCIFFASLCELSVAQNKRKK